MHMKQELCKLVSQKFESCKSLTRLRANLFLSGVKICHKVINLLLKDLKTRSLSPVCCYPFCQPHINNLSKINNRFPQSFTTATNGASYEDWSDTYSSFLWEVLLVHSLLVLLPFLCQYLKAGLNGIPVPHHHPYVQLLHLWVSVFFSSSQTTLPYLECPSLILPGSSS